MYKDYFRQNSTIIVTTALWLLIVLLITLSQPAYLSSRTSDPLALVHSLPFLYYVLLGIFVVSCYFCVKSNRYVHIFVITQFSLLLWYTPYYLGDFLRIPDTAYFMGLTNNVDSILNGHAFISPLYANSYPGSFLFNFIGLRVTNIDLLLYTKFYPAVLTFLIILLWYIISSKIFDKKTAFISTLLAVPAMMYIEIHPSPHSMGTILTLFLLLLLMSQNIKNEYKVLSFILIFTLIITHPLSPLILVLFIIAQYLSQLIAGARKVSFPYSSIGLISIAYLSYAVFRATSMGNEIFTAFYDVISLNFFKTMSTGVVAPTSFIYPIVSNLRLLTYGIYAALTLLLVFLIPIRLFMKRGEKIIKGTIQTIGQRRLFFIILVMLLVISSIVTSLGMGWAATKESFLLYALFCLSTIIGSFVAEKKSSKYLSVIVIACLVLVTLFFPITSYGMDASLSYPKSEEAGIHFLVTNVDFQRIPTISAWRPERLALFMTPGSLFKAAPFPPSLNDSSPDMVILLKSAYFEIGMRRDLSFSDNRYTIYSMFADNSSGLDRVFSSGTVTVFIKTG